MVIVHIANIDTSIIGGVQIAVPNMIKAQSLYADVCLINTFGDIIDGVQTIQYKGNFNICEFPKPYNCPDIVIFHELYRFEYISIYKKLVKLGIPYVIIPHGCFSIKAQQKKRIKKIIANIIFFNNFIKKARFIQYLSSNEHKMSAFKNCNYIVMGNGVSSPKEKKSSFSVKKIRFIYIGRLEIHIKGLDILLDAIKSSEELLRRFEVVFEIYGPDYDDSHQILIEMIRQLKIEDLVRVDKEKIGIEKKDILLSATCFIQTSRTEGLPLGPLEALSYGIPCIVTKGVGIGDIIESYGAGYQSENTIDGVSKSIELFIHNIGNLKLMSQSATRLIEDNYNIDLIAEKTVDTYKNILN